MTYFRMQLLSHGTGPLAPGHMAMPPPGYVALHGTGTASACRQPCAWPGGDLSDRLAGGGRRRVDAPCSCCCLASCLRRATGLLTPKGCGCGESGSAASWIFRRSQFVVLWCKRRMTKSVEGVAMLVAAGDGTQDPWPDVAGTDVGSSSRAGHPRPSKSGVVPPAGEGTDPAPRGPCLPSGRLLATSPAT